MFAYSCLHQVESLVCCTQARGALHHMFNAYVTRMIWLLQALSDAHAVRSCRRVQMNLVGDLQISNAVA